MSDVITYEQNNVVVSESTNVMKMIHEMMMHDNFDAVKLEKMQDMFFKAQDRERQSAFMRDFVLAQGAMPAVIKKGFNAHTKSKYAKLEDIIDCISPVMAEFGFAMSFGTFTSKIESHIGVSAKVLHKDGHCENYSYDSPFDNKGINGSVNKTNPHAVGSALSYGQRYLCGLIWNLLTTDRVINDDDGNAAGGRIIQKINDEQVATLLALIEEVKADIPKLKKYLGIESFSDLPAAAFAQTIKALEKKRSQQNE